ncbi:phosphotransferase [Streptomyces sp. URMC 123]|uniref:phosphotransferase n=1 Tax=Streptomyces sp. URMC 123 TaxID=3423403 RepID=UPI003F1D60B2
MVAAHAAAADAFGAGVRGPRLWGWRGRTLGQRADHPVHGPCWLRLLSVPGQKAGGKLWEGTERAAAAFSAVRKPALHGLYDWATGPYAYRAELTAYVDEPVLSSEPVLRRELDLSDGWFATIRTSLTAIAATATDRTAVRQEWISRAVPAYTGRPAPRITQWTCAHGDFHAANLTRGATVLDWEGWGLAPRGYDAATLYAYAQLAPRTAARVRRELAPLLEGEDGRAALLVVCAELLQSASRGDHPDLVPRLRALVDARTPPAGEHRRPVPR